MKDRSIEASPQIYARLAGAIYLLVIVFGGFSEGFVTGKLLVAGDAAATARNILGAADLWSLSVAGNLIVPLIAVPQLWIEYLLLKPTSRNAALLFLLLNIASLAVESISKLFLLMVLPLLSDKGLAGVFSPDQVFALGDIVLLAHDISFHIALIFFGAACLTDGYLIIRSTYLPTFVGVLMQLAGLSYLIASFAQLFAPTLGAMLTPWILLPVLIGETTLCLWLLIKGVNVAKWNAQLSQGA